MARRIPALYNLDLNEINETISQINIALAELERSGGGQFTTSVGNEIIWDESVNVGTTKIVKSDLNLTEGVYQFYFEAYAGATVNYAFCVNNDTTAANYRTVVIYSENGANILASGADDNTIASNVASGKIFCTGTIFVSKQSNMFRVLNSSFRETDNVLVVRGITWEIFKDFDNIHTLSIIASAGGQLGKHSRIKIWRIA